MAKNRAKLTRRQIVGVKIEATTGAEEILANADYLEAFGFKMAFDDTFTKRPGAGLGNRAGTPGAKTGTTSFTTELRNSGSATLPLSATLLTAAGFKNAGGVFSLLGIADTGDTATVGGYLDGRFKSLAGVQYDVKMTGELGKAVLVEWSGKGKRSIGAGGPRDVTPLTVTPMSGLPPVVLGITLTLGGTSYRFSKFELALGNKVELRPDAASASGYLSAQITERDPTFTLDPEAGTIAAKDFYSDYENATEASLSIVLGSGTNGTVTIAGSKLQLTKSPEDQDGSGFLRDALSFQFNETTNDDELTITYA